MRLDFLAPDRVERGKGFEPVARSPFEPQLRAAGARFELRDGWRVATRVDSPEREADACRGAVGICDRSQLGKLELQGDPQRADAVSADVAGMRDLAPGEAARVHDVWWCRVTPERVLVLCEPRSTPELRERLERSAAAQGASVVELTSALAALALAGPRSREVLARLTALDLRESQTRERAFCPGSLARVPAAVLREAGERFLLLCGSSHAEYVWSAVTDAAATIGGAVVGSEALAAVTEVPQHA